MRSLLHICIVILLAFGIFLTDLVFRNVLPYPFSATNLVFVSLMLFLIMNNSGKVVWLSFLVHLLLDIYSATPFGTFLFAGTMSMLLEYWLYRDLFTNKSIWALIAMTASGLIIFRVIYTVLISIGRDILWHDVSLYYMWEMLFTLLVAILMYGVIKLLQGRRI